MKIDVVVPNRGWVRREVVHKLSVIEGHRSPDLDIRICLPTGEPIDHVRNTAAAQAVEDERDYVLFMDSDNPPLPGVNIFGLVDSRPDIVVFPTPMWIDYHIDDGRVPVVWNVFDDDGEGRWNGRMPADRSELVDAGGTGCMLVRVEIFRHVKPAFMRTSDEWGRVVHGSDLLFCRRAREAGFTVRAEWQRPCSHFKEVDLFRVYEALRARDISHVNSPNINTPEYWDAQWTVREPRSLPVHSVIADLALSAGPRILDYGCGIGDVLCLLGPGAIGVDFSEVAVKRCHDRGLKALLLGPEAWKVIGGPMDCVVMSSIAEHLEDDAASIAAMSRQCRRLIVCVPHNRLPPGVEPEHRRVYTRSSMIRLLGPGTELREVDGYLVGWNDRSVDHAS